MNFWQRVDYLLKNKGLTRKELAYDAGFNVSNIGKGIVNDNVPSADTAVRIAKKLQTTAEYLVTGFDREVTAIRDEEIRLYKEYAALIHYLDSIPEKSRKAIERMIIEMSVPKI